MPLPKLMGRSLPPGFLIRIAQGAWKTGWLVMMDQMAPRNAAGEYIRPDSAFRHRVKSDSNSDQNTDPNATFPAAFQRYHLIVGWSCPWAHRTLIVRSLKGLEHCIPITIVSPSPEAGGWIFETPFQDCFTLKQFYQKMQPGYQGRSTVPVLWDSVTQTIVNNESAEIIEILNEAFSPWAAPNAPDLYPEHLQETIVFWNQKIYETVNNGVYRCGFAQTQTAYEEACRGLFQTLDEIEAILSHQAFLCGDQITLADVRLFPTLIRFEAAYAGLFKCNLKPIAAYPHLSAYRRRIYHSARIAETCNLAAVTGDYYGNLFPLNPGGIIPLSPDLQL